MSVSLRNDFQTWIYRPLLSYQLKSWWKVLHFRTLLPQTINNSRKLFFNYDEVSNEIFSIILHFGVFQSSQIQIFLQTWWRIEVDFTQNFFILVRFRALELNFFFNLGEEILPELLNWKIYSTTAKYWMSFHPQSFNLARFRALALGFFSTLVN